MPNLSIVTPNSQNLVDDWLKDLEPPNKYASVTFKDDPVALACASHRAWQENFAGRWADLGSVVPNEQDRQMASDLRHYYRARLTWQALKTGQGTTVLRRKIAAIVNDTHAYTNEDIGLLHRLPYFYVEDQAQDRVFSATQDPEEITFGHINFQHVLRPLERVLRSRRIGEYVDFYWTSPASTAPYLLVVKQDNPLISIIESLFKRPEVKVQAQAWTKHPRGYYHNRMYYQLANLVIV